MERVEGAAWLPYDFWGQVPRYRLERVDLGQPPPSPVEPTPHFVPDRRKGQVRRTEVCAAVGGCQSPS